ncbi:ATP-binding protein [Kitasatospora sp. NPDC057198]|uniref:ATP-binding protein n=1 Tax=Kitasatospora sp. NPDC057198 TaxID=3346046 RepID=UPI003632AC98
MNTTGAVRPAAFAPAPWRSSSSAPRRRPDGPRECALPLTPSVVADGELANWVTGHLARWRHDRLATGLRVVTRELARNALAHGLAPARAVLALRPDGRIRIAVTDAGPGFDPDLLRTRWIVRQSDDPCGGLALVAGISAAWGTDRLPLGHRAWADLDPASPGRALLRIVP